MFLIFNWSNCTFLCPVDCVWKIGLIEDDCLVLCSFSNWLLGANIEGEELRVGEIGKFVQFEDDGIFGVCVVGFNIQVVVVIDLKSVSIFRASIILSLFVHP